MSKVKALHYKMYENIFFSNRTGHSCDQYIDMAGPTSNLKPVHGILIISSLLCFILLIAVISYKRSKRKSKKNEEVSEIEAENVPLSNIQEDFENLEVKD